MNKARKRLVLIEYASNFFPIILICPNNQAWYYGKTTFACALFARFQCVASRSEHQVHLARKFNPGQNSQFRVCSKSDSKACKSEPEVHLAGPVNQSRTILAIRPLWHKRLNSVQEASFTRKLIPDKIHFLQKCDESEQSVSKVR